MRVLPALACLALLAPSLAAAQETERHAAALAAGYKASFLCSGIFTAGLTEAEIARLKAPIGLPIRARSPWEVAISVTAEIVATANAGQASAREAPGRVAAHA